jgi:hypothetical protein
VNDRVHVTHSPEYLKLSSLSKNQMISIVFIHCNILCQKTIDYFVIG